MSGSGVLSDHEIHVECLLHGITGPVLYGTLGGLGFLKKAAQKAESVKRPNINQDETEEPLPKLPKNTPVFVEAKKTTNNAQEVSVVSTGLVPLSLVFEDIVKSAIYNPGKTVIVLPKLSLNAWKSNINHAKNICETEANSIQFEEKIAIEMSDYENEKGAFVSETELSSKYSDISVIVIPDNFTVRDLQQASMKKYSEFT